MITSKQKKRLALNKQVREALQKAIAKIRNQEEAEHFLKDLFSSAELQDISRRYICAKFLFEGNTFQEIEDLLGMGPLTINKIHFKTKGSWVLPRLFKI